MACCSGEETEQELDCLIPQKIKEKVKVTFVGEPGVGKSSLITRYMYKRFDPIPVSTIGVSFLTAKIDLPDDRKITLEFWDTAGQERYHSIGPVFYRGSDAVFLVFDLANRNSFDRLEHWEKECMTHAFTPQNSPLFIVVGSKVDLVKERQVSEQEGREWCLSHFEGNQCHYFETSAKDDIGVAEVFDFVAKELSHEGIINIKSAK